MMKLEDALRAALRPHEPPPGFTQRVMARLDETPTVRRAPARGWRAAAAALTMAAVLGGWAVHEAARQRAAERAGEEVLVALRITSGKLRAVQDHVQQISVVHE